MTPRRCSPSASAGLSAPLLGLSHCCCCCCCLCYHCCLQLCCVCAVGCCCLLCFCSPTSAAGSAAQNAAACMKYSWHHRSVKVHVAVAAGSDTGRVCMLHACAAPPQPLYTLYKTHQHQHTLTSMLAAAPVVPRRLHMQQGHQDEDGSLLLLLLLRVLLYSWMSMCCCKLIDIILN